MARPPKMGLEYFPKDVDFYEDIKIMELTNEYGPAGITVYDYLLTQIYREGYFIKKPIGTIALFTVRAIGSKWLTKEFVINVITYCGKIGLFRVDLLEQGILTSAGIQKRYAEVTTKRKFHNGNFWILDAKNEEINEPLLSAPKNRINGEETPVSGEEITQKKKERKRKEKGKERKKCDACDDSLSDSFSDEDLARVVSEFEHSGFMLSGRARDELIDMLDTYSAEWTIEAIHRASDRGKKSIAYIRGILNNWQQKGAIDDGYSGNTSKDSGENKSVIDFSDGWTVV